MRAPVALVSLVVAVGLVVGRQPVAAQDVKSSVERYVAGNQKAIVGELVELLSIPNVATDKRAIRENADVLRVMLEKRGFLAEVLEAVGNPLVFGEMRVSGATRTLLLYSHYDGQPVDPAAWKQPSPFTPILRDGRMEDGGKEVTGLATLDRFEPGWRIYARSASDDKSPIVSLCTALDALKASGLTPTSNLRVILDGEEEAGSTSLVPAIERYRDKLAADAMLIFDGPIHPSEKPTLVFGARGVLTFTLTVFGPKFALHSGHYGNWVPNPAMRLAQLLSTFKDDNGRVVVEGFYDGIEPLRGEEQEMLDAVPDNPEQLKALFGISTAEDPQRSLQQGLQIPSFNVRGLSSAFVGADARTIVPDKAVAAIDIRLVRETPADQMVEKVRAHLRKQGYHVVAVDPDDATRARYSKIVKMDVRGDGTNAYRTSPLHPVSQQLSAAMTRVFGEAPVRIRTSGGTVPIAPFIEALGFPAISVPTVNFDNNQHGENENLRLGHFLRGITIIAAALTM